MNTVRRSIVRICLAASALALLSLGAPSQSILHVIEGEAAGDRFGTSVALCGDFDLDGHEDFAVGAPEHVHAGGTGRVYLLSGLDGHEILHLDVTNHLGLTAADAGDVDLDGVPDVLFGGIGMAQVRSGASGAVLHTVSGLGPGTYAVDGGADVNQDGFPDFIVGVGQANGLAGRVVVYSGFDGSTIYTFNGPGCSTLGNAVAFCGDLDLDQTEDFILGAQSECLFDGEVFVYSGATGTLLYHKIYGNLGSDYGWSVAGAGDVNGDGVPDFMVGDRDLAGLLSPGKGTVDVWSGADGSLLYRYHGTYVDQWLGWDVAGLGDVTGDGSSEFLYSALSSHLNTVPGSVVVRSGSTGDELWSPGGTGNATEYGYSIDGGGDVNLDGIPDFIVGEPGFGGVGPESGRVVVYSGSLVPGTPYCFGDGGGTACPCSNTGGSGEGCANSTGVGAELDASGTSNLSDDDLRFHARGLVPGQPVLLFAGTNAIAGGAGVPFGDGLRCAGGGVVRMGVKFANGTGQAFWGAGLLAGTGWNAGDVRRFQGWYRDPVGSPCASGFNLTNGYEIALGP